MYRQLAGPSFNAIDGRSAGLGFGCPFGFMAFELLKPRMLDQRVRRMRRMERAPTVQDAGWYGSLPPALQARVEQETSIEELAMGQCVLQAGDSPTHWYGVLQGFIWPQGQPSSAMPALPRRAWFGEHMLLMRQPSDCTFEAAVPTRLARVPLHVFEELMADPGFCRFLMHVQVQRSAVLRQRLSYARRLSTDAKVAVGLAELFAADVFFAGEYRVDLRQTGVSTLLNLSRQRTNAALNRLQQQGEVDIEYGSLLVLDPARLMRRALDGDIT